MDLAAKVDFPVHRISQGSGISMPTDEEIRQYVAVVADRRVEILSLRRTPRPMGWIFGRREPAHALRGKAA